MKRLKIRSSIIIVLWLSIFSLSTIQSFAADVSVSATIDSTALWMGEQTRIRLQLAQNEGEKVWLLPTFSDTIVSGIEVLDVSQSDTTRLGNNRIQIDRSILITSFDSGFFYIPPFRYLIGDDTIETSPLSIKILPMEVDTSKSIVDIKGVRAPSSAWWLILWDSTPLWVWYLLAALAGAAILAFLLYYLYRRGKRNKLPLIAPEDLLPPHEKALLALSQLREEKLWQEGREKEYYTHLIDILREYLDGRFGIQAMEMTSSQILDCLRADKETKNLNPRMREILEMADFVKFAKMRPMPEDNESVMRKAVDFVEDTRPIENTPEEKEVSAQAPADNVESVKVSQTNNADSDFEKYGPSNSKKI